MCIMARTWMASDICDSEGRFAIRLSSSAAMTTMLDVVVVMGGKCTHVIL